VSQTVQAALTKYHRVGGLYLFLTVWEADDTNIKATTDSVSGENPPSSS
jgi:hypothetical protein